MTVTDWAGNTRDERQCVDDPRRQQLPRRRTSLTLTPLTGTANQYWDSATRNLYYNPTVRRHVLALECAARRLAPDLVRRRQRRRQQQQPA